MAANAKVKPAIRPRLMVFLHEHFPVGQSYQVSLPGLTGQSNNPGQCLLDRPVKPGDDSLLGINLIERSSNAAETAPETWPAIATAGRRSHRRRSGKSC